MARPTLYKPEYCQQVIEHCKTGKSLTSFASSIDVHTDTIQEWAKVYPEFSVAKQMAQLKAEAYIEDLGINAITSSKPFNFALYQYTTRVRFRWKDVQHTEVKADDSKELEALKEELRNLYARPTSQST